MDKKKLTLLIVIGAIVAYLLLRPKQAVALEQPVAQPIAAAPPASPPPPDLGTQLTSIGAQVTAGLGAINTVTTALPAAIPTATAAVGQAAAAAAAIPAQVGTAISTAGAQATAAATQLSTAASAAASQIGVAAAATYQAILAAAPYLLGAVLIAQVAKTTRAYDPSNNQCCDVNPFGKFNCRWDWSPMECIFEVYDWTTWSYEKKRAFIFTELNSLKGIVAAKNELVIPMKSTAIWSSRKLVLTNTPPIIGAGADVYLAPGPINGTVNIQGIGGNLAKQPRFINGVFSTPAIIPIDNVSSLIGSGNANLPPLKATTSYAKYFRILTPTDQIEYKKLRDEVVAYNKALIDNPTNIVEYYLTNLNLLYDSVTGVYPLGGIIDKNDLPAQVGMKYKDDAVKLGYLPADFPGFPPYTPGTFGAPRPQSYYLGTLKAEPFNFEWLY